jgi:diguanylate cyclase (GGDEF)-like protein
MLAFSLIVLLAWRINSLEQEVHDLSLRDELTGLYNRRGFYILAEQALHLAERTRQPLSVLFLDLDNLKRINDGLGHDVGSLFLREVADLLKGFFRESDVLGRIGGDEFVIAVDFDQATVTAISARLEEEAVARNAEPDRAYPLSFSVGHVTFEPGTQTTLEDLLDNADQAMYMTKRRKKMLES